MLYTLNETAADIFKMIKKGLKEDEIIERMLKKYQVKKERVEKDVKALIGVLKKKGDGA